MWDFKISREAVGRGAFLGAVFGAGILGQYWGQYWGSIGGSIGAVLTLCPPGVLILGVSVCTLTQEYRM